MTRNDCIYIWHKNAWNEQACIVNIYLIKGEKSFPMRGFEEFADRAGKKRKGRCLWDKYTWKLSRKFM